MTHRVAELMREGWLFGSACVIARTEHMTYWQAESAPTWLREWKPLRA